MASAEGGAVSDPLDPLIEGYLSYLTEVGRKVPRTVIDVRCTLRRALVELERIRPGVPLWKRPLEDLLRWIDVERDAGRTTSSLAKYLSHVRGFLEYAWRSGRASRNVLDGFSLADDHQRNEPRSLTLEEAERLVRSCPTGSDVERRDRLVILLLYGCGLRTSELCWLDVANVQRERHELNVLKAKGDRPRSVPIPDGVYTELLAYLLERGKRGPLFRTAARHKRLAVKDVCNIVAAAAQRAGLSDDVTPKALRHSFATHLMDRGVDLAVIASLMGHRSPQETGVYLHVLPGRREAAVHMLRPGGRS
jgi:site-specific recombinase XerD